MSRFLTAYEWPVMARITLSVLEGLERGHVYRNLQTPVTIGREEVNDVQLNDERISRLHAKLQEDSGRVIFTDLNSTNGTFVNGTRVEATVLKPGDVIRMGGVDFHYGKETRKGTRTIIREVSDEIEEGKKGYRTILREIVQSTEPKPKRP